MTTQTARHSLSEHVDKLTVYREPDNKERLGTSKKTEINNPVPVGLGALRPGPGFRPPGLLASTAAVRGTHRPALISVRTWP